MDQVGAEHMNSFRGNKGDILVNDFGDPHQFNTWRHVTIFNTGSNYAEVGWVDRESAEWGASIQDLA